MMHRHSILATALFLLLAAGSGAQERIRVLIVDGQNNHDWKATTAATKRILDATGRFEITTSTTPPRKGDPKAWDAWRPDFSKHDVVLSNYNGQMWPKPVRDALEKYVGGGGGLVVVHAADNAFSMWPAWNAMIGVGGWGGRNEKSGPYLRLRDGRFVQDPSPGRGGGHGRQHEFVVETRAPDHPIMKGLPTRWRHARDELYDKLRGPAENVTVLASAFADEKTGGTGEHEPILMAIAFDEGRVFHTTLGHHGRGQKEFIALGCVGFATTLARGTEWAATGRVTLPVPEDFPDENAAQLIEPGRGLGIPASWKTVYSERFGGRARPKNFAFTDPAAWRMGEAAGRRGLELFGKSRYEPPHRSPLNIALVDDVRVGDFVLDVDLLQTGRDYGHRDMCVIFGFQDPAHYYYAHIASKTDQHAHNIFIVNGAARKRISTKTSAGHAWGKEEWHRIRIVRETSGRIDLYANEFKTPLMIADDATFEDGWIGVGSFDDTGIVGGITIRAPRSEKRSSGAFTRPKPGPVPADPTPDRRAIRRDVPLTDSIRRALEAGTRDFTGRPGPNYWQLKTDFTIRARLDREKRSIIGSEKIVLHNESPDELRQILLRLDHNIFRPKVPRGGSVPAETTEGMVVTRLVVDGETLDLTPAPRPTERGRRRRPRAGTRVRGLGQTLARISLEKPVAPGAKTTLEIDWHTRLPGGDGGRGHRMTQRWGDTLFQPTQWFPRIAKYDDLTGWDTNVYLGPAEFYNNFGRFDVKLDVPAGWITTATGVLQNPEEVLTKTTRERLARVLDSDDEIVIVGEDERGPGQATADGERLVWHYVAENVNDFAWATARDYVWKATRATIPGRGPIPIHMVHLPERADRYARAGAITRHALEFYSELWAPYPFPQLTLQDGPSAGMEYPMVLNSNQGAADHETAHQWWPMMVGTDETKYGWMDEGLNVYMNVLSRAHSRGRPASFDRRGQSYGRTSGEEAEPPMMWTANYAGNLYGFQTYRKATLMLSMLGGIVGDEAVQAAIREYTRAWAFKHPSPWDFVFSVSNELGRDLGWFWYYWLWTTESVDGRIAAVDARDGKTVVRVRQDGQMPSPVVLQVELADEGPPVRLMPNARRGADGSIIVTWPADVWFDGARTFEADLDFGGRRVTRVILDPFGRFPDRDPSDNEWKAPAGSR